MANIKKMSTENVDEVWHSYLVEGSFPKHISGPWYTSKKLRKLFRRLPSSPRCSYCYYPFDGIGGTIMRRVFEIERSEMNPHICNLCEQFAKQYKGGTEIELTILFADVRGSTKIAEKMNPTEYSRLINRFFNATTKVLFDSGALVEKMIGDAVTAFYTPGFAKNGHAKAGVSAAKAILAATGHGHSSGPWIPVGVGVHTGVAFVGAVDSPAGSENIVVLGDTANIGARLASEAKAGEVLVSETTAKEAGLDYTNIELRKLELKGRSQPLDALVLSL